MVDTTAPTISSNYASGLYKSELNVSLTATDDTDSAPLIYYTIDQTEPTTATAIKYIQPIKISDINTQGIDTVVKAVAVDRSGNISKVFSFEYTIEKEIPDTQAPTIAVSPDPAMIYNKDIIVTITASDNKTVTPTIYYTLNGVQIDKPSKGLYLKKVIFRDGRVDVSRIIL